MTDKSNVEKLADEFANSPIHPTDLRAAIEADRAACPEGGPFWRDRWKEAADQREDYHAEVTRLRAKLAAVGAVHGRYFDMDREPGDWDEQLGSTNPEPEDVWRYDRDFRAALATGEEAEIERLKEGHSREVLDLVDEGIRQKRRANEAEAEVERLWGEARRAHDRLVVLAMPLCWATDGELATAVRHAEGWAERLEAEVERLKEALRYETRTVASRDADIAQLRMDVAALATTRADLEASEEMRDEMRQALINVAHSHVEAELKIARVRELVESLYESNGPTGRFIASSIENALEG